ncbi:uncharacterized protein LOC121868421 isoform X2 [Homarus americanus]|uniref:uncharacterized protein LOC121868421 isoform X2 n=1 Tax=Homarus americanus TaxID=6706 RepID=UPI001C43CB05|nr:uncharacterized protein LOC121868421 isoform X2 [Homarus americanus]
MVRMIGAMPAVAVRQQRKHVKHEEIKNRPSTLTIEPNASYPVKPPGGRRGLPTPLRSPRASPRTSPQASPAASPKQSPVTSPRTQQKQIGTQGCAHRCVHGYLCGRVSLLHVSVVCVLLGITLLVVGLVQLAPGAATVTDLGFPAGSEVNKYAIIAAGTGFLGLGFLLLIILCACQKNTHRRRRPPPHLVQSWGPKKGKRKSGNVYAMDCVTSVSLAQAHPNHKGKSGSGRSSKGHHSKGHSRQMQVHTVEGAVATDGSGGSQQQEQDGGETQLGVTEKDISLEGFVKSPSESDALIQSCSTRPQ